MSRTTTSKPPKRQPIRTLLARERLRARWDALPAEWRDRARDVVRQGRAHYLLEALDQKEPK